MTIEYPIMSMMFLETFLWSIQSVLLDRFRPWGLVLWQQMLQAFGSRLSIVVWVIGTSRMAELPGTSFQNNIGHMAYDSIF